MAPPGGYASIGVGRNVPKSVGPRASLLMLAGALVMGGGLYRVGTFNVHRRYVAGRVLFLFLGWSGLEKGGVGSGRREEGGGPETESAGCLGQGGAEGVAARAVFLGVNLGKFAVSAHGAGVLGCVLSLRDSPSPVDGSV